MARFFLLTALALIASIATATEAQLSETFYNRTCPQAVKTVSDIVGARIRKDSTIAAGLLRLQFHDCFVRGCDASVLLDSTINPWNQAEKDGPPNKNSLRGFDVVDEAKAAVEAICPGVVSCADVLSLASRDSILMIGGPSWSVPLGRRDGNISRGWETLSNLPPPHAKYSDLISIFAKKGMSEKDMFVLSGGHTIGKIRCSLIQDRLYNFSGSPDGVDPSLNSTYAAELKQKCKFGDTTTKVPLDPTLGGNKFDSLYYNNLKQGYGICKSDAVLTQNSALINRYSTGPIMPFYWDFAKSMEKLSQISVLTGTAGEIRKKCNIINSR